MKKYWYDYDGDGDVDFTDLVLIYRRLLFALLLLTLIALGVTL